MIFLSCFKPQITQILTEILIFTETRMNDLFNTDYMDYMESCAAILIILIIRVDKKKVHLCESLNLCESV